MATLLLGAPSASCEAPLAISSSDEVAPRGIRRILAVDDQPDVLDLLSIVLGDAGYAVDTVTSGHEALTLVERSSPDLMLLDLVMPGVDGWQVLEGLVQLPSSPPAVVLTARQDLSAFARAFRGGAAGYLTKPFELDDLVSTCHLALERRPDDLPQTPERRGMPRRPFFVRVQVRSERGSQDGALLELTPVGACVTTPSELPRDAVATVDVRLSPRSVALSLRGSLVWDGPGVMGRCHGLRLDLDHAPTASSLHVLFGES